MSSLSQCLFAYKRALFSLLSNSLSFSTISHAHTHTHTHTHRHRHKENDRISPDWQPYRRIIRFVYGPSLRRLRRLGCLRRGRARLVIGRRQRPTRRLEVGLASIMERRIELITHPSSVFHLFFFLRRPVRSYSARNGLSFVFVLFFL